MKTSNAPRFWIGVASKNHVGNGLKLGICQFCHGKKGPAQRLKKGDYIIYYSPKVTMEGSEQYQKFTAIGVVTDDTAYQAEVAPDFRPFRRNVSYFANAQHVAIKPLIDDLPFIRVKKSWGAAFRYGFLEIDAASFGIITQAMIGRNPAH